MNAKQVSVWERKAQASDFDAHDPPLACVVLFPTDSRGHAYKKDSSSPFAV